MSDGVITSQVCKVVAPKNHGKTAFMKSVCGIRMLAVQAGNRNGDPRKARLIADDRKPEIKDTEDGQTETAEGEYSALGRFIGARVVTLDQLPSINIFHSDLGMKEQHVHELAIKVDELVSGVRLPAFERFVLLIGINKMYAEYRPVASPGVLELCLNTLTLDDLNRYYKERDRQLLIQHAGTLRHDPRLKASLENLMEQHVLGNGNRTARNIDDNLPFLQTAGALSVLMANAQQGEFGGVIGNENSLYDILNARRAIWDWTGVSRKARTILEFVRMTAQELSLKHPELDIVPDIRLGDEERSAGDEPIHLWHRLEYVEKARAFRTFDVTSEQTDYGAAVTLGAEGSVERGIVDLINAGTSMRWFGKQPYDTTHLHELSKYGIAEHDLYQMTMMEQGCWAVQTGGSRKLQWIRHHLVPSELDLILSNTAAERQIDRIPIDQLGYRPRIMTPDTIRRMSARGETMQIEPQE
jgi:hypothetical protein